MPKELNNLNPSPNVQAI